ncbi:MAG: hypothetical protein AAGB13_03875 [Cyanobacteria bacterium P01_F01_bin.33]
MQAKPDIFDKLTEVEISSILKVCDLPDLEAYTDEEADRIRDCRVLIQQGKTYEEAARLVRSPTTPKKLKSKKRSRISKPNGQVPSLDLAGLRSLARKRGYPLSYAQVLAIATACDLDPDADNFSPVQAEQFVRACDRRQMNSNGDRPLDATELDAARAELMRSLVAQSGWDRAARTAAERAVESFLVSFQSHLKQCVVETTRVLQQRQDEARSESNGESDFGRRIEANVERLFGASDTRKQLSDGRDAEG